MFSEVLLFKNIAFAGFGIFDKVLKVRTSVHVIMMHVLMLHRVSDMTLQNYAHFLVTNIQGVTGETGQTSGECSLGQTIPI